MGTLVVNKGVQFVRQELRRVAWDYQTLADCLEGERAMKGQVDNDVSSHLGVSMSSGTWNYKNGNVVYPARARRYLPIPNPTDDSVENQARYDSYVTRSVFYNATERTRASYMGALFQRPPAIEVPAGLDVVVKDTTGERVDLVQSMKETVGYVLPYGRAGLLADYPATGGAVTAAQDDGSIRPTLRNYAPWNITNWRERQVGSMRLLELVVLREPYTVIGEDGFEVKTKYQYRELSLDAGGEYRVRIWKADDTAQTDYKASGWVYPTNSRGQRFRRIPFFFIGAANNDPKIDRPPFLDIAKLNVGHFRNSADYEESVFMVGQPTPVLIGITDEWYKDVLGGQILLGARASIPLPAGADAKLLQPEPNTMPKEAMEHKEAQLVTLGARIAETPDVMRTATEATITAVETSSPLLSTAANVGTAYEQALAICAEFEGVEGDIICQITTEATLQLLGAPERQQLREDFIAGLITWEEMRENLRRAGVAGASEDEEARKQFEEAQARQERLNQQQKETNNAGAEA